MEFKSERLVQLGIKVTEEQADFLRSIRGYNRFIRFCINESEEFKKHQEEKDVSNKN